MSNSLSASFPKYWSRRMQRKYYKTKVYSAIANQEERATLKKGTVVDRPYRSEFIVNDLGSDGSYSRQDITDTGETLTIDKEKEVSFYVREIDEMQSNYKTANKYADDAGDKLGDQIDGLYLQTITGSSNTIGAFEIAGTGSVGDGLGFTLSTSNIVKFLGEINAKMDAEDIPQDGRFLVLSPQAYQVLWEYLAGKESNLGDKTGSNGMVGTYASLTLYKSNNLLWSAELGIATNPTADDTVVINGVTFTFKAAPSAAGEVDIAGTAAGTVANLVAAINGTGTPSATTYIELSAADRKLMHNITATDGTTKITLAGVAKSFVRVSETLTAAADLFTVGKEIQHNFAGQGKVVDLVIQKAPMTEIKDRSGYLGKDVVSWTVLGVKMFAEDQARTVNCLVRSDAF